MLIKKSKAQVALLSLILLTVNLPLASHAAENKTIPGLIKAKGKLSQEHKDTKLNYDLSKEIPMGGIHNAYWANCQAWSTPVAAEYAIHSMEHGATWIAYNNSIKPSEIKILENLTLNNPFLLVTKVPSAKDPITITAWGFQIKAKKASDPRISLFIKTYTNSKTTPELGAPCQNGLTDPLLAATPQSIKRK